MADNLCEFSLIFPDWLGWVTGLIGLLVAVGVGTILRFAPTTTTTGGDVKIAIGPFEVSAGLLTILVLLGTALILIGLLLSVASSYEPFGRSIGSKLTVLIDKKDPEESGQFNNESMAEIEANLGYSGRYVVQLSSAAKRERISGSYTDNHCYAELVSKICRQESQRLACTIDPAKRVIKVCHQPDDAECPRK
jgi:hypothetical protein